MRRHKGQVCVVIHQHDADEKQTNEMRRRRKKKPIFPLEIVLEEDTQYILHLDAKKHGSRHKKKLLWIKMIRD